MHASLHPVEALNFKEDVRPSLAAFVCYIYSLIGHISINLEANLAVSLAACYLQLDLPGRRCRHYGRGTMNRRAVSWCMLRGFVSGMERIHSSTTCQDTGRCVNMNM
eukprot:1428223-Pleurochrysis_carterae.AAC.5